MFVSFFFFLHFKAVSSFSSAFCSVTLNGEAVVGSGSWNFPFSVVSLLIPYFSFPFCYRSEQIYAEIQGKAQPFSPI